MGWRVRGRFRRERIWVYLWLIHVVVCQKPTVVKQFSSSFFKKKYSHCIGISKGEIEIHVFLEAVSTFKEEKS